MNWRVVSERVKSRKTVDSATQMSSDTDMSVNNPPACEFELGLPVGDEYGNQGPCVID
jgi:hypothetical protein